MTEFHNKILIETEERKGRNGLNLILTKTVILEGEGQRKITRYNPTKDLT